MEKLVAGAAHDIANALSAVMGWVQLARQGADFEEALDAIEGAAQAARVTANILLGKADDGSASDLSKTAHNVMRLVSPQARKQGITVRVNAPNSVYSPLTQTAAFRCLWNLVLNSCQASGVKTIHIEVSGDSATSSDQKARFVVRDDGPGMDQQTQEQIWTEGFTTHKKGHGLGLAVVRRLIAHVGGTLSLESELGRGTEIHATLPLSPAPREKKISGIQTAIPQRVLVVEDDENLREMIITALSLRGAEAIGVSSIAEVRELHSPFDIAIVDYVLTDANGYEVLQHLRKTKLARLIILASGATDMMELCPRGAEPDRFLRKPFDVKELLDVLASMGIHKATG